MRNLIPRRYAGIFEFLLPPFLFCETYANKAVAHLGNRFVVFSAFTHSLSPHILAIYRKTVIINKNRK